MTADEKIDEAQYNLDKLLSCDPMSDEFKHQLSNFLSSARSILYHLLSDYYIKFGLGTLNDRINEINFQKKSKNNNDAVKFYNWYYDQHKKLESKEFGFLLDKGHASVHKEKARPRWFSAAGIMKADETGKVKEVISVPFVHFEETMEKVGKESSYPLTDARGLCQMFLIYLKEMVKEAHSNF